MTSPENHGEGTAIANFSRRPTVPLPAQSGCQDPRSLSPELLSLKKDGSGQPKNAAILGRRHKHPEHCTNLEKFGQFRGQVEVFRDQLVSATGEPSFSH